MDPIDERILHDVTEHYLGTGKGAKFGTLMSMTNIPEQKLRRHLGSLEFRLGVVRRGTVDSDYYPSGQHLRQLLMQERQKLEEVEQESTKFRVFASRALAWLNENEEEIDLHLDQSSRNIADDLRDDLEKALKEPTP